MTGPKKLRSCSAPGAKVMIGVPTSAPVRRQRLLGLGAQLGVVGVVVDGVGVNRVETGVAQALAANARASAPASSLRLWTWISVPMAV